MKKKLSVVLMLCVTVLFTASCGKKAPEPTLDNTSAFEETDPVNDIQNQNIESASDPADSSDTAQTDIISSDVPAGEPVNDTTPSDTGSEKEPEAPATDTDSGKATPSAPDDGTLDNGECIGTVEMAGEERPLFIIGGISYCIIDDHAEAIYTGLSDVSFTSYAIRSTITYEDQVYNVTRIDDAALYGCDNATSILIPDTVTSIGTSAFDSCSSLPKIELPRSLESIEDYAFFGCRSLKEIVIPDSVKQLGNGIFMECEKLVSVKLPADMRSLPVETFSGCLKLTDVTLPDSIETLEDEAFWYCEALSDIKLPESLVTIGSNCFFDCLSLKSITLPKDVDTLGDGAFDYCDKLETVYVNEDNMYLRDLLETDYVLTVETYEPK